MYLLHSIALARATIRMPSHIRWKKVLSYTGHLQCITPEVTCQNWNTTLLLVQDGLVDDSLLCAVSIFDLECKENWDEAIVVSAAMPVR